MHRNVGKRGIVPPVKTPEQRGPRSTWAYESRDALGLSDLQVVHLLGKYDAATLRKAESDPRAMSRPLWRALTDLYGRLSAERNIALRPIPAEGAEAGEESALVATLTRVAEALEASVREQRAMTQALARVLDLAGEDREDASLPGASGHRARARAQM